MKNQKEKEQNKGFFGSKKEEKVEVEDNEKEIYKIENKMQAQIAGYVYIVY